MRKGLLFAGSMVVDRIKFIDAYPREGNLTVIRNIARATGGMAINNAINIKVLDPSLNVGVLGRVGDDADGQLILSSFDRYGIDRTRVAVDLDSNTSFTDVMTVISTGVRTFFHSYGACAKLNATDFDIESIANRYEYVQVGYHLLLEELDKPDSVHGTVLGSILHGLRKHGVRTSIDLVSEEGNRMREIAVHTLPYVDDLIVNEIEAGGIVGIAPRTSDGRLDIDALCEMVRRLFDLGVNRTVVIHAPEGAVGAEKGGVPVCVGAYEVRPEEIRGTTGAGDAFCSGVIYGLYQGWSLTEAMELGNAMGAMNLFDPSCTGGSKPLGEVRDFMNHRRRRDLV